MKEKLRILCYGDSNTWGAIVPGKINRFDRCEERYTKLIQKKLKHVEVVEEGLIARTAGCDDIRQPKGNRNGALTFVQAIYSHDPLDYITIMLGTNDMKEKFNKTPKDVAKILEEKYIKFVREEVSKEILKTPKFIIIAPPLIETDDDVYKDAKAKSRKFNEVYQKLAEKNYCLFVDNDGVTTGIDGVHMTKEAHKVLADKICKVIKEELKKN